MDEIEFTLDYLPKRPNEFLKSHGKNWTLIKAEKNTLERLMQCELNGKCPKNPWTKVKLLLVRQSSRCPDYDGLVSSFKYVVDLMVNRFKIFVDDSYWVTGQWEVFWAKAPPKKGKIYVKVLRVKDGE